MALDTVKLIFANRYGISVDEMTAESLITDLCADSLDLLELLMYIEDEFGFVFPDEIASQLKTLGDISEYIASVINDDALADIHDRLSNGN